MDEMGIKEVKEIKEISEKINSLSERLSLYTDKCHDKSLDNHNTSENALLDLAATIGEIVDYTITLEERIAALEEKEA